MDKSYKIYKKALKQYYKGNVEKAIELCEKSISENMKNNAAINLKGLLQYFKGELNNAKALWKLNYDVNEDAVSKKYLQDSKEDEKNFSMYSEALGLVKSLSINEALILLNKCKESDFNCINVDNYLALCHIKKGEYKLAFKYVDKVLKLDRKNKMALESEKLLIQYGEIKRRINFKPIALTLGILCIAAIIVFLSDFLINKINTAKTKDVKQISSNEVKPKVDKAQEEKKQSKPSTHVQEIFPYEDMKKSIESKDFEKIYSILAKWKDKNLKIDDKTLIVNGEKILKEEGTMYFYNKGTESLKSRDNKSAQQHFLKAYSYSKENYLYPHIIFMMASAFEADGRIEDCLNYYVQYDNLYDNKYDNKYGERCYEETVLYKLAVINSNMDIAKAKTYAGKLSKIFPKSNYNNSIIKQINSK